ncbi:hypothetical protein ACTXGQ_08845 [Marinobacter sp. 1Y8]
MQALIQWSFDRYRAQRDKLSLSTSAPLSIERRFSFLTPTACARVAPLCIGIAERHHRDIAGDSGDSANDSTL